MREYWIRIVLGALAIFIVGMVGITLVRRGVDNVREVAQGTGPITLPVAFVPFRLDGERIGTVRRIRIHRQAPNQVKSINIRVRLTDSVGPGRLQPCILVAEGFEQLNDQTTIRCASPADTANQDLARIGEIELSPSEESFDLWMPRAAIRELTDSDSLFGDSGPLSPEEEAKLDSIVEAAQLEADSVMRLHRGAIDSARRAARQMADSARRR